MDRQPPYRALVSYAANAGEAVELWRTAAGLVVAYLAGLLLYQMGLALLATTLGEARMSALMDEVSFFGQTPRAVIIMLLSFVVFAVGLAMTVTSIHGRPFRSLIGDLGTAQRDLVRVVLWVGALFLVLTLLAPHGGMERNPDVSTRLWLALLPLALFAVLVQAGTEELIFRGYLLQQLAARFPNAPAWMIAPALLFGLAHWAPESAGANATLFLAWAAAFGIAAADLTARTGTIGAAVGFHVANNAFAILGVSLAGPGTGLALYQIGLERDDAGVAALMPVEFATLLVAWLAARVAVRA